MQTYVLVHELARTRAVEAVRNAPAGMVVQIKPAKRSLDQNAKLHAVFMEIAAKGKYHGRAMTMDQWKVLFISGHAIATGREAEIVPGIEGEFVNIREASSAMSVGRMSSLIEYVSAYCAENGIELSA